MESEFLTLHESLSWARSRAGTPLPRRLQPRPLRSRPPSPTCASTSCHLGGGESPDYLSARSSGQSFPKSGAFFIK